MLSVLEEGKDNLSGFGRLTRWSHYLSWGTQGEQIQRGEEEFAFGYSVPPGSTDGDASSVELRKSGAGRAVGLLGPGDEGTALESGRSWNVQFYCLHWPLILDKLLELLLGFVEYKLGVM